MTSRGAAGASRRRSGARAGGVVAAVAVLMSAGCGAAGAAAGPATGTAAARTATTSTSATPTDTAAAANTTDSATSGGPTSAAPTSATPTSGATAAVAGTGASPTATTGSTAQAHLPAGFAVDATSAVSAQDWWVLGTGSDGSLALAKTVDGGRSWTDPVLPAGLSRPVAGSQQSPGLAFSSALAGSIVTAAGAYWVTSDGGAHWRDGNPSGAPVMSVAATSDASIALLHTSVGFALARGTAGAAGLTTVLGASRLTTTTPSLATSGRTVVVISGARSLVSTDDGKTFSTSSGPCTPDLGGRVSVSGATVVAWCATGMDGSGWISTDGGSRFAPVPGASGANSTAAAPTGDGGALVWADPGRGVHLSGTAASTVSGRAMFGVSWIGFTTTADGFAVAGATATGPAVLWHTVDGGRRWSAVRIG